MKLSLPISLRAALITACISTTTSFAFSQEVEKETVEKTFTNEDTGTLYVGGNSIDHGEPIPEGMMANFDKNVIININNVDNGVNTIFAGGNFLSTANALDDAPAWEESFFKSATFDGNTQINVNSSNVFILTGGNGAYNYSGYQHDVSYLYNGKGLVDINFKGDTNINIDKDSQVGFIVGGNYGNSMGAIFEGNTSITSNQLLFDHIGASLNNANAIIGASVATTQNDTTFKGNSTVLVTGMLSAETNWLNNKPITFSGTFGSIVGGLSGDFRKIDSRYITGSPEGNTRQLGLDLRDTIGKLEGNTTVTINHQNTSASENNMLYAVIGGSIAGNGMDILHTDLESTKEKIEGQVNLNINSKDSINFQKAVVGGNVNMDAEAVHANGYAILVRDNLSETLTDKVNVEVTGGNFAAQSEITHLDSSAGGIKETPTIYDYGNMFISGSLSFGGGKVTTTEVISTIDGGIFDILVGANASTPSLGTDTLSGSAWQSQGQDYEVSADRLYSAYGSHPNYTDIYADAPASGTTGIDFTSGSMHSDTVNMTVNGGSTQLVVAGNYIASEVTHITGGIRTNDAGESILDSQGNPIRDGNIIENHVSHVESSTLTITGGTHQKITAGSFIGANITTGSVAHAGDENVRYTATQGDIAINISGADTSIKGDFIAAAGIIETFSAEAYLARYISSKIAYDIKFGGMSGATAVDLSGATKEATLQMTTQSTTITLDAKVTFENGETPITVSGGYQTQNSSADDAIQSVLQIFGDQSLAPPTAFKESLTSKIGSTDYTNAWIAAYDELVAAFKADGYDYINPTGAVVTGNRLLSLNDNAVYNNLANVAFVDFDEVNTGAGAVVNFSLNAQDLDSLNGRHIIDDTVMDGIHSSDINSLRKTGSGTLVLGGNNGQTGKAAGLSLDVQQGKVALSANSAATTQTNFETLRIRTDASLDMSAGSNTAGAAAGINGHLQLEDMSIVIADAGRSVSGTGTSMTGGKLTVDAKFMLSLSNMDSVELGISETFTLNDGTSLDLGLFNIVLFSNLSYTDPTSVVGIDFLEGMWYGEEAKIALATDYMKSNFYLGDEDAIMETGDVFIVWRENGDMVLTSGTAFTIPEPSTASLSLLALAGLVARRRRRVS